MIPLSGELHPLLLLAVEGGGVAGGRRRRELLLQEVTHLLARRALLLRLGVLWIFVFLFISGITTVSHKNVIASNALTAGTLIPEATPPGDQ